MAIPDESGPRPDGRLNGFLQRWRRNASQVGIVTAVVTTLVAAVVLFVVAACKSMSK
jgi:hypothetical protein